MTAIAGLWRLDGRLDAAEGCARMLRAQEIYGPDAGGQWSKGEVSLGRRLMRLLPEDVFDRQPLVGGGGRFILVADLRLDNRDELSAALQIPAATATTLSDAAILLAAIEQWEDACLEHLIGDYAFAVWDSKRQRLLLARDPLGFRPLYYHRGNGFFAFASMPKGLHALPEVPYAPDEEKIAEFLVLLPDAGTRTFFVGIDRIVPAHGVAITSGGLQMWRHWKPSRRSLALSGPDEYAERARELLDEAVRCRLRGVKNVAATLSGGLDSSAVVATAARLLTPTGGRVTAFTGVPREGYAGPCPPGMLIDEGPYAAATAAMYPNIEHVLVHAPSRSPLADLDRTFLLSERPMLAICNLALQNRIIEAAHERKLTVLLGGALGNFGLSYHGMTLLPELFRTGHWIRWWRTARTLVRRRQWSWAHALAETLGPWFPAGAWIWVRRVRRGDDPDIFGYCGINPDRFETLDLARRARQAGSDLAGRPWKDGLEERIWCLERCDSGDSLKGGLAEYRLDVREPLADVRLIEFCLSVPTSQFLRDGTPRALARRTLADRLPRLVLDNERTGLDSADWHERLTAARHEVATELERLAACAPAASALDLPRLRRLVENWPTAGWERPEISSPYRLALMRAISTGHFLRRVTGGNE
jgi:asparagine synthase (glutamine-hydrolysing)